jgi:hypothetical protein
MHITNFDHRVGHISRFLLFCNNQQDAKGYNKVQFMMACKFGEELKAFLGKG